MKPILAILSGALFLVACSEREVILPGERLSIRPGDRGSVEAQATDPRAVAIALPNPQRLAAWPLRVGNAVNDPPHATLRPAPARAWTADIGAGDSRRQRITADPVSDGALIYTLDAQSRLTATTLAGATAWTRSLVPASDGATDASGGGLAVVGETVYASTGFGELHALDRSNGGERWVQRLDAPITTPKVAGGTVYLVSRDNRAWALEADTGRILWDLPAAAASVAMATAPAPAITDRLAIFPFGSGDMLAVLPKSGLRIWGASVTGTRRGVAYAQVGDITGDPVVSGDRLFAGTAAGRMVALDLASGERIWTADEGAVSPIAAAGGSVFAVSDRAQLLRLDAASGEVIWRADLPFYRSARLSRREGVFAHFGPVLAGGRLWVASSDGALRGFDPTSGALAAVVEIPGGAASRPIALADSLFVVGRDGQLHAFR